MMRYLDDKKKPSSFFFFYNVFCVKKNLFLPPVCRRLMVLDRLANGIENQIVYKK